MKKKLNVDENLVRLAQIFDKNGFTLYVVGGFVRNALMGFCETDVDVCSSAQAADVERMAAQNGYHCEMINPKLGTVHIFDAARTFEYEHTTFRAEIYPEGGAHSPERVEFVDDIEADASRRDFSINAMYYDILGNRILDFYDGVKCVKNHLVKTVETPSIVFSRDGLRILRMVRLACELGYQIEEQTWAVAHDMISQLGAISPQRFNKEIVAMLFADNKYKAIESRGAQCRAVELLSRLGAWEYVLTPFWATLDTAAKARVDNISWSMLALSPPALRVSSFVIDLLDGLGQPLESSSIALVLGEQGVRLNKREVARQTAILQAFATVRQGALLSQKQIRLFLQANFSCKDELFGLLHMAGIGEEVLRVYQLMLLDHTPFCVADLAINGDDILTEFPDISPSRFSQIFADLLTLCATMPECNTRDSLLDAIERM